MEILGEGCPEVEGVLRLKAEGGRWDALRRAQGSSGTRSDGGCAVSIPQNHARAWRMIMPAIGERIGSKIGKIRPSDEGSSAMSEFS